MVFRNVYNVYTVNNVEIEYVYLIIFAMNELEALFLSKVECTSDPWAIIIKCYL